ncbi:hypothetical protein SGCOL_011430 [Colletotrichum sp. CLE4]
MDPTSPSYDGIPVKRSQLLSSITELKQGIQAAEADADRIETRISYKEDWITELRSERIASDEPTPAIDKAIKKAQARRGVMKETLFAKKDEIARLRSKLKKKEIKLAAIPQVESSNAPDPNDNEDAAALLEVTGTPMNAIFTISADGKTYTNPPMLRGVPVAPISEIDAYWNPMWKKFAEAVDEEKVEREYQEYLLARHQRMLQGPLPASEDDPEQVFKKYQRSLRQAKVTKQWFNPGHTIHPNQLMAKEHLPETGLCDNYVLYKICNILSRINAMYERGELGMPPLHFLMWRMSVSLERYPHDPWKSFCRVMVDEKHSAYDSILRQAEIRGAQHVGDYNFYLASRSTRAYLEFRSNPNWGIELSGADADFSAQRDGQREGDGRKTRHSEEGSEQQTSNYDGNRLRSAMKLCQSPLLVEEQLAIRAGASSENMISAHSWTRDGMDTESLIDLAAKPGDKTHCQTSVFGAENLPMEDGLQWDSFEKSMVIDASGTEATAPTPEDAAAEDTVDNHEWIDMFVGSEEIRRQMQPTNMEAIRASVGESPFPKNTGRRVSHGFVFPWYRSEEAQKLDELEFPF